MKYFALLLIFMTCSSLGQSLSGTIKDGNENSIEDVYILNLASNNEYS